MRKFGRHVGYAIVAATVALLGSPVALADNASFVAGARGVGFSTQTEDTLIRMGRSMCRMLQPNLRRIPEDIIAQISRAVNAEPASIADPGKPRPRTDVYGFFVLSVHEYCPWLAYRIPPPPTP